MIEERMKFFGLNGVIQEDRERFRHIPLLEFPTGTVDSFPFVSTVMRGREDLEMTVADIYRNWKHGYGYYGDVIDISYTKADGHHSLDVHYIARLAFPKPNMSADLVPFVIDNSGEAYLIAVTRKHNPGRGGFALPGGFQSVINNRVETPAEAAVREAGEEVVGLDLELISDSCPDVYYNIVPKSNPVKIMLGLRKPIAGGIWQSVSTLEWLGTFRTEPDATTSYADRQRVDMTDAYLLPIRLDRAVDKAEIATWFTPGDDAETVEIIQLNGPDTPTFVFGHHDAIFKAAWKMIADEVADLYMEAN